METAGHGARHHVRDLEALENPQDPEEGVFFRGHGSTSGRLGQVCSTRSSPKRRPSEGQMRGLVVVLGMTMTDAGEGDSTCEVVSRNMIAVRSVPPHGADRYPLQIVGRRYCIPRDELALNRNGLPRRPSVVISISVEG